MIKLKNILTEKKEIAPKSIQGVGVLTQRNQHNVARAVSFLIKTQFGSGAKNDFIKAFKKSL